MKVLSLGLDSSILDINSPLARRAKDYGEFLDRYDIIVPGKRSETVVLSPKVTVMAVAAKNKIVGFFNFFKVSYLILKKKKYDLITVQDQYYVALIGLALKWRLGISLHIQIHGWEKFNGLRATIAKYVLPRADAVRTVSQRLKRQLINEFGVKEEKITVVPIYLDMSYVKCQMSNVKTNDKFVFLTVGRLVPVKNIAMQIEAMAEIINRQPTTDNRQPELWIVGEGTERKNLEFRIKNLGIENNVKLAGFKKREELDDIYSQADAFLLTSWAEGWPLVIVEAASFGLPIIMTDVGSAGELIRGGENGIVIPVGDKEKLAEAMIKIMDNEGLRKRLSEGARQAVSRLPSKEETLKLYKESWQKALIT